MYHLLTNAVKVMQEVLKQIIKDDITPVMSSLGFARHRNTFLKQEDGFQKVMDIQSSKWNDSHKVSFTINCGIFFPEMYLKCFPELPKIPKVADCLWQYRKRIGELKNKGDVWYELNKETDIEGLKKEVKCDVEWYARRYFEQYQTIHNFFVR